ALTLGVFSVRSGLNQVFEHQSVLLIGAKRVRGCRGFNSLKINSERTRLNEEERKLEGLAFAAIDTEPDCARHKYTGRLKRRTSCILTTVSQTGHDKNVFNWPATSAVYAAIVSKVKT